MWLRRQLEPQRAAAALELLILRNAARKKFTNADRLFFIREALEQATGEQIAAWRASHFPPESCALDACCGLGADTAALARRGPVLSVESDPIRTACARANLIQLKLEARVYLLTADVTTLNLPSLRRSSVQAAFCDPSRRVDRGGQRKRARTLSDYLPHITWLNTLRDTFPFTALKLSPVDDLSSIQRPDDIVEYVGFRGECREAVLWCGEAAGSFQSPYQPFRRNAVIIDDDGSVNTLIQQPDVNPIPQSEPRSWLYEPNPAVIRAGRVAELAVQLVAWQLDSQIAYLTSDNLRLTPFASAYRSLHFLPFSLHAIQEWLRKNNRRVEIVKRRGVPFEPEEIRRRLSSPALKEAPGITLILTRVADRASAILCERVGRDSI